MNSKEFEKIVEEQIKHIRKTFLAKIPEYANDEDVLVNFKHTGRMKGETPVKALYGMLAKHLTSWEDYVLGRQIPTKELLDEKIGDIINYFILSKGLFLEEIEEEEWEYVSGEEPVWTYNTTLDSSPPDDFTYWKEKFPFLEECTDSFPGLGFREIDLCHIPFDSAALTHKDRIKNEEGQELSYNKYNMCYYIAGQDDHTEYIHPVLTKWEKV